MSNDQRKLLAACKENSLDEVQTKAALILLEVVGLEPAMQFVRHAGSKEAQR